MSNNSQKSRYRFEASPRARQVARKVAYLRLGFETIDKLQTLGEERASWANVALTLEGPGTLLQEVFAYCDLDPARPYDWRVLIDAMAEVCFKSPGRLPSSTTDRHRYQDLLADLRELQQRRPSLKFKTELSSGLRTISPFRKKYEKFKPNYLRKLIAKALDPSHNVFVLKMPGESHESFGARILSQQYNVPKEFMEALMHTMRNHVERKLAEGTVVSDCTEEV
jgi:hypothetical protein